MGNFNEKAVCVATYHLVNILENLRKIVEVSCLINTTNCCGLSTPAASIEDGKTKGTINLLLWLPDNLLTCL